MNLRVAIFTTSKDIWFKSDFPALKANLENAEGVTVGQIDTFVVTPIHQSGGVLTEDQDGDTKFDWDWFRLHFTTKAKGYNAVVLHISREEKRRLGITVNGTYRRDPDEIFECWFSADEGQRARHYSMSEWLRLAIHELGGHGFERFVYGYETDLTHTYDYELKQLHRLTSIMDFTEWNRLRSERDRMGLKLIGILTSIVNRLRMRRTFLQVCTNALGTDATPDDLVPDAVACAVTVTTLIRKVDPSFPLIAGTWTLMDVLDHRRDFERVSTPEPGCLILSPTGTGKPGTTGHVGVIMEDGRIASNNSRTGTFEKNYSLDSWSAHFGTKQGMPVLIYKNKKLTN